MNASSMNALYPAFVGAIAVIVSVVITDRLQNRRNSLSVFQQNFATLYISPLGGRWNLSYAEISAYFSTPDSGLTKMADIISSLAMLRASLHGVNKTVLGTLDKEYTLTRKKFLHLKDTLIDSKVFDLIEELEVILKGCMEGDQSLAAVPPHKVLTKCAEIDAFLKLYCWNCITIISTSRTVNQLSETQQAPWYKPWRKVI